MEGGRDVKSLAAMFEKKSSQPPPFKKADKIKPAEPEGEKKDVKSLAAMFERKTTVKLD